MRGAGEILGRALAWCKLEDTARHHIKFTRLARDLKIHRAEARGLFLGLCSWASVNAPDGVLDGLTHHDMEEAADWQGSKGRLAKALIDNRLVDIRGDGTLEIHDFFDRAGSHKAAVKKRAQRDRPVPVPGRSRDCTPLEERRGEEKKRDEREERATRVPAMVDNSKGIPMAPFVIAEFRRQATERTPPRPVPENNTSKDTWAAAEIYVRYPNAWKDVVAKYLADEFYSRYGWALGWLAKNLDQVANRSETDTSKINVGW